MDYHAPRRSKLRRLIKKSGADALLVTNSTNVTYLTGFSGDDSYFLVTPKDEVLLSDSRFTTQIEEECPGLDCEIRATGTKMLASVDKLVRSAKVQRLGLEAGSITLNVHAALSKALTKVELVPCTDLVEQLRQRKDAIEIKATRLAVRYAERAFNVVRNALRAEQTEREIAHELENQIRLFGGDSCSFNPIVAAGPRAALPHAIPTSEAIGRASFVLIDWGASGAGGYKSDLTRVLVTGKISPKLERIYKVVLKAQERAIAAIRPGVAVCDVDAAARKTIAKAGFGKQFGHGLGHGVGLDIHENPRMSPNQTDVLQPGMIVTVEPGIYIPGFGGVRLEDDVLVTRDGHEVLTSVPKEWDEAAAVI